MVCNDKSNAILLRLMVLIYSAKHYVA